MSMELGCRLSLEVAIKLDDYLVVEFLMCLGGYRDEYDDLGGMSLSCCQMQ